MEWGDIERTIARRPEAYTVAVIGAPKARGVESSGCILSRCVTHRFPMAIRENGDGLYKNMMQTRADRDM